VSELAIWFQANYPIGSWRGRCTGRPLNRAPLGPVRSRTRRTTSGNCDPAV